MKTTKIVRRGRTYYRARVHFPPDPITGIKPPARDFYATDAKAAKKKAEDFQKRKPGVDEDTTFGAFLEHEFLKREEAKYKAGELSWTRYSHRKSRITRFVLEYPKAGRLRSLLLADIKPTNMEQYFTTLLIEQVSPETRNLLRQDMMLALQFGKRRIPERWEDYFDGIEAAKVTRKKKKLFDPDDILERIWDESLPLEYRLPVAMEFILNARPSELFALKFEHVNKKQASITIGHAMVRAESGYVIRETTKNGEKSDRTVALGDELLDMLLRHKAARKATDGDFILVDRKGNPYNKDSFEYAWADIKAALSLPDGPTFYSLKHLGNSYALANGVSAAVQAKKMGHTTTRMAESAYRTVLDSEQVKAVSIYSRSKRGTAA